MHWNILWAAVLLLVVLVLPGAALAVEEHAGKPDPAEFTGLKRWDLGLWTLVVFGLLLFVLGKFAWGPMMEGLEKREQRIQQARDDAVRAREDAEAIKQALEKRLGEAHDEARSIVEEARRDGQRLVEDMRAKAQSDIQAERDRQRREIETAKDQALQEIYTQAVQLASLMSSKAVGRELSPEVHSELLNESLKELGQHLKA